MESHKNTERKLKMGMIFKGNTAENVAEAIAHLTRESNDTYNPFPNYAPNVLRLTDKEEETPLSEVLDIASKIQTAEDIEGFCHLFSIWKTENAKIRRRNEVCEVNEKQIDFIKETILALPKNQLFKVGDIVDMLYSLTAIFTDSNGKQSKPVYKTECAIQDLLLSGKIERKMVMKSNGFYVQGLVVK